MKHLFLTGIIMVIAGLTACASKLIYKDCNKIGIYGEANLFECEGFRK